MSLDDDQTNGSSLSCKKNFLGTLDPRIKLLLTALCTTLVFFIDVLPLAAGQMAVFTAFCLLGGISPRKLFAHYKLLLFLAALVIALQVLFGGGLSTGLMISCRIVALAVLMPALTMTTDARLLALGITRLGLNYRAAHIITSTINLIPSFEEEARLIIDARRLRGVKSLEKGNGFRRWAFMERLVEYPAIVLPLMIKAMRHAQLLGLAMDTRAFGAYKTRTWLQELKLSAKDYLAFAAGIVYSVIAVAANHLLAG